MQWIQLISFLLKVLFALVSSLNALGRVHDSTLKIRDQQKTERVARNCARLEAALHNTADASQFLLQAKVGEWHIIREAERKVRKKVIRRQKNLDCQSLSTKGLSVGARRISNHELKRLWPNWVEKIETK